MSTHNDGWSSHAPRATCTVHEEQREALVRYPKPNGGNARPIAENHDPTQGSG